MYICTECFYRAMLCIARSMSPQHVCVSVRLSVRLSHAGILSKRLYLSSIFFSLSGSHAILVFHTKRHCNIPTGTPLTGGGANATGVRQNRDFRPISRFNSEMILWKANRKPHPSFRMVYAISNDLE